MPIRNMVPGDAHSAMTSAGEAVLLDVRTVEEYERGHPQGAVNVPWALLDPTSGQMTPNPDFLPTVRKHFDAGRTIFASCQMGGRSMRACQDLEAAGYTDLVNVDGGFGGRRDPGSGQVVTPGWQDSGLPVESTPSDYEQLKGG